MQNFLISLEVVLPLFIMLAIGYVVKMFHLVSDKTLRQLNNVCFRIFLPMLLFVSLYNAEFDAVFNPKLMRFAFISVLCVFAATFVIVSLIVKDKRRRSVLIQAIFRSNFLIFGLPITISLWGPEAAAAPAIVGTIVVPMYNILAVIVLSVFSGSKFSLKKTLIQIITNPLLLGTLVGLLFLFSGIRLPEIIMGVADDLASVATPLALIVLGGSFQFSKVKSNKTALFFGVLGRLVIVPAIMIPIAVLVGFRGIDLVVCLSIFTSPTAVSSFTMAQQMGADDELAGELVVFTAFFSILTIFCFVFILKQLMLL